MKLKLAFSTCPNDTFMFHAMVHKLINTSKYDFEITLCDIEELNEQASQQINDISKISFNAYGQLTQHYQLLSSGAALGFGNGPLIISKHKIYHDELADVKMAIPGFKTTANLLLETLFPEVKNKKAYLFSDIEDAVLSGEADAGLIIHETRFSFHKKGLLKVADLGEVWGEKMKLPLPLGGIVIRRDLDTETKNNIQQMLAESVKFAMKNPKASIPYVKNYARDLDEKVIQQHIELYVNDYSIDIKPDGKSAIEHLVNQAARINQKQITQPIFI
jgi:1,4-dihydroxy-6-naphthoate synthase